MRRTPSLPKIYVIKVGKQFKVGWDYQEAPESSILSRKDEYLSAFIDGALVGLNSSGAQVGCASGRTGIVKKLDEETADRLATILKNLLHPLVTAEYKRLLRQAKLPEHLRDPVSL